MASTTEIEATISIKVMVDKEKNSVVYAEAGHDFFDILFSFMTLPIGTLIRLLEGHADKKFEALGSLTNVYKSVDDTESKYFRCASNYCCSDSSVISTCNKAKCHTCAKLLNKEISFGRSSVGDGQSDILFDGLADLWIELRVGSKSSKYRRKIIHSQQLDLLKHWVSDVSVFGYGNDCDCLRFITRSNEIGCVYWTCTNRGHLFLVGREGYQCLPSVVHCDLKPNNILLADDMVANVGDFGLARLCGTPILVTTGTVIHEDLKEYKKIKFDLSWAHKRLGMVKQLNFGNNPFQNEFLVLESSLNPLADSKSHTKGKKRDASNEKKSTAVLQLVMDILSKKNNSGVGLLAESTIFLLTLLWGTRVIIGNQEFSSERCFFPCSDFPELKMWFVAFLESKGGREFANFALEKTTRVFLKTVSTLHIFTARLRKKIGDVEKARALFHFCKTEPVGVLDSADSQGEQVQKDLYQNQNYVQIAVTTSLHERLHMLLHMCPKKSLTELCSRGKRVLFIDKFVADVNQLRIGINGLFGNVFCDFGPEFTVADVDGFAYGTRAVLSHMATMFGGIATQEVIKACSGMFHPIFQLLYFVSIESLPKSDLPHYIDNNSISELRTILFKGGGDDTDMDTGSNEELILIIGNECCADFKARGVCLLTMEEGRDLMVLRRNTLLYCAAMIACTSNGEQPEVGLRRSALGNCDAVVGFAD